MRKITILLQKLEYLPIDKNDRLLRCHMSEFNDNSGLKDQLGFLGFAATFLLKDGKDVSRNHKKNRKPLLRLKLAYLRKR